MATCVGLPINLSSVLFIYLNDPNPDSYNGGQTNLTFDLKLRGCCDLLMLPKYTALDSQANLHIFNTWSDLWPP